jgi:protein Mpv17
MKGPFIGRWNFFLEKIFPLRTVTGMGNVSLKALSKRVAADQLFM